MTQTDFYAWFDPIFGAMNNKIEGERVIFMPRRPDFRTDRALHLVRKPYTSLDIPRVWN
jgi:hypothetical protein